MRKPTTECFQIHQKCLRWFSLCFRGLRGQFGVACEEKRMFSQAKFGVVALKTIYLFGCLRGNFGRYESFSWLFLLIRKC